MKIALVEYNPIHPRPGVLDAYNEVVESYQWGFAALGYEVERRVNSCNGNALNIVFGAAIPVQLGLLTNFPPDTIIVNLERQSHRSLRGTMAEYVAANFQIWDYSLANMPAWNELNPRHPVYYARTAYAPCLEKVVRSAAQDIDVLYYGGIASMERLEAVRELAALRRDAGLSGLSLMVLSNVYGPLRDEMIARAKVVINLSTGSIFEIVRASYLMANRKAVVSTYVEGNEIEEDMAGVVLRFKLQDLFSACATLVEDHAARAEYEVQCYEAIKRRDIRDVIKGFFD